MTSYDRLQTAFEKVLDRTITDYGYRTEISKEAGIYEGDVTYKNLRAVFLEVLGNNNISVEKQMEYKKRVGM